MKKVLIIGAGFAGCTSARVLANAGWCVKIFDKRDTIGGQMYDQLDKGVIWQKYGPHIFHTDCEYVMRFLDQFTEWELYEHKVLTSIEGKLVSLPVCLTTLHQLFSPLQADKYERILIEQLKYDTMTTIDKIKDIDEELYVLLYKKIFENYTRLQWGPYSNLMQPIASSRVPVRVSTDDRYFTDKWQVMPKNGFTGLFNELINHQNIKLHLNCRMSLSDLDKFDFDLIVFTGEIDEFCDDIYGELPYIELDFDNTRERLDFFQSNSVINYPNSYDFTRVTEYKHFYRSSKTVKNFTIVTKEFPRYTPTKTSVKCYPIPAFEFKDQHQKYVDLLKNRLGDKILIIGRLATYKYLDMDDVVKEALDKTNDVIGRILQCE